MITANNFVTEQQIKRNNWPVIRELPAVIFAKVGAAVFLGRKRLARDPFLLDNNMMSYSIDEGSWDVDFARATFNQLDLTKLVQAGALPSFNPPAVSSLTVQIPQTNDEQQAIGKFFDDIDTLLQNQQKRVTQLLHLKQAMLTKMFPGAGETVPEIRFDGFDGEWESSSVGELFSFLRTNSFSRAQLTAQKTEVRNIHYGDVLIKFGSILDIRSESVPYVADTDNSSPGDFLSEGDIIFADAAEDLTVGKCTEVQGVGLESVVSGLHTIAARPTTLFAPGFLGHGLNSRAFHHQLIPLIQGTKVSSISTKTLGSCQIAYPSLDEQKAIGTYFTKLDFLIELEKSRLTKLQQLKAALLDKMLV